MTRTPITPIRIPGPLRDRAAAAAKAEGVSLAHLVRRLLETHLKSDIPGVFDSGIAPENPPGVVSLGERPEEIGQ
jgi:hypothetical protein